MFPLPREEMPADYPCRSCHRTIWNVCRTCHRILCSAHYHCMNERVYCRDHRDRFLLCQVFLQYHGHKQWASPSFIRKTLVDLGISKGGNEPIKQHHFMRQAKLDLARFHW